MWTLSLLFALTIPKTYIFLFHKIRVKSINYFTSNNHIEIKILDYKVNGKLIYLL